MNILTVKQWKENGKRARQAGTRAKQAGTRAEQAGTRGKLKYSSYIKVNLSKLFFNRKCFWIGIWIFNPSSTASSWAVSWHFEVHNIKSPNKSRINRRAELRIIVWRTSWAKRFITIAGSTLWWCRRKCCTPGQRRVRAARCEAEERARAHFAIKSSRKSPIFIRARRNPWSSIFTWRGSSATIKATQGSSWILVAPNTIAFGTRLSSCNTSPSTPLRRTEFSFEDVEIPATPLVSEADEPEAKRPKVLVYGTPPTQLFSSSEDEEPLQKRPRMKIFEYSSDSEIDE